MTSQKELFNLFRGITGKTTHSMNNGNGVQVQPWQESRVKEFAFMDTVDSS
jgi:hypothetical protein